LRLPIFGDDGLRGLDAAGEEDVGYIGSAPSRTPIMNASDTLSHSISVLLWMILPVVAGYLLWRFWLTMRPDGERIATACARGFGLTAILLVVSPMMVILFWKADPPVGQAVLLPLAGLFSHVFGGLLGFAFGRISGLSRSEQGAAFLGGTCSNILSFGGITLQLTHE